jgi:hypothetical protein
MLGAVRVAGSEARNDLTERVPTAGLYIRARGWLRQSPCAAGWAGVGWLWNARDGA